MEQRLSCSITNNVTANVTHNLQGTMNSFDTTLCTAMESMTSAVTRLIESNEAMIKHKETMDDLTQENRTLATRIEEQEEEDETQLTKYVYYELSYTIGSQSEHERWRQIKQIEITRCRRIGTFNRDKIRPVRVEFQHRLDVEYILSNKRHLKWGVYMDKTYTAEVESK